GRPEALVRRLSRTTNRVARPWLSEPSMNLGFPCLGVIFNHKSGAEHRGIGIGPRRGQICIAASDATQGNDREGLTLKGSNLTRTGFAMPMQVQPFQGWI